MKINRTIPACSLYCIALTLVILLTGSQQANAQNTSNNSDTLNTSALLSPDTADARIERRLVELALNSPPIRASQHEARINQIQLKRAKNSWLDLLTISTTYNDQSFTKQPQPVGTTYVYPKYYFGISVPLGIIFSKGSEIKMARESSALNKENREQLSRTIRIDIIGKYLQYKNFLEQIRMQTLMLDDITARTAQIEERYRNGTIPIETYIAAQGSKNGEVNKLMGLQLQKDLLTLDIEKMIGTNLNSVLKLFPHK